MNLINESKNSNPIFKLSKKGSATHQSDKNLNLF